MNKFALNTVAFAAGVVAAGGALAGTISLPGGQHNFAVEALTPTTAVTTPNIVYNMGVGRPVGNDFTIINTPSAGSTFGPCIVPVYAGAGAVAVTLKRQSGSECAYDVHVNTGTVAGDTFTWNAQTFATHPLAAKGSTIAISINLKDPGETAQVDNPGPITSTIATSSQAINVYAPVSDTFTIADVNAAGGPLTGFVDDTLTGPSPTDTATQARAHLRFDHNSAGRVGPDGATPYVFSGTTALTLSGPTFGVAANGFCLNLNNNASMCEVGERFTVAATAATFANATAAFGAQGTTVDRDVTFVADGTTPLGTSRTFAVSGTITPQLAGAAAESLADTAGNNAKFWVWSANASQLMTPYFNNNPNYVTRFFFLNTGPAVGYSTQCFTEGGGTVTNGPSGTLAANATTNIPASSVCTFPAGSPRGAVIFTINGPINNLKGTFNMIRPDGVSSDTTPLVRPYNAASTTE